MNWFRIHEDYDKLKEPWRLFIMLFFLSPFFLGLAFMENKPAWAIGVIIGCLIGFYRIIYIVVKENERNTNHTR